MTDDVIADGADGEVVITEADLEAVERIMLAAKEAWPYFCDPRQHGRYEILGITDYGVLFEDLDRDRESILLHDLVGGKFDRMAIAIQRRTERAAAKAHHEKMLAERKRAAQEEWDRRKYEELKARFEYNLASRAAQGGNAGA